MERENGGTMGLLAQQLEKVYGIGEEYYRGEVKRGLRNSDGTGVLAGVSKVGSVQGYFIQDGQRIPKPGQLYYRGIELNEIVEAHRKAGTFGYEEVAYLLLMGSLPARGELARLGGVLYFTDGYGVFPERAPDYPVAFVMLQYRYDDINIPHWARTLVLDAEKPGRDEAWI